MEIRLFDPDKDTVALQQLVNHYIDSAVVNLKVDCLDDDEFESWYRGFEPTGRYRLLVGEQAGELMGFASSNQLNPRRGYETSVFTSIYMAPGAIGRGQGSKLYAALFESIANEDIHRAYALITMPNEPSVALHERFDFRHVGILSEAGRKNGQFWDVLWMEKKL